YILISSGLELAVLDLHPRDAAGSRRVGLRPVNGGDEPIAGVARHLVDSVDDLLAREIASRGLQAPDEQIGVQPPVQRVLVLGASTLLDPFLIELEAGG